jgi:hypothetical protein
MTAAATHVHLNKLNRLVLRGGLLRTLYEHSAVIGPYMPKHVVSINLRRSVAWKWAYVAINEDLKKPVHFLNPREPFNYVELNPAMELCVNNIRVPYIGESVPWPANFQLVVKLTDNDLSHYSTFVSFHTKRIV